MNDRLEEKLATVKYKNNTDSHLIVCQSDCKNCSNKSCVKVCPANVYNYDEEKQEMQVSFENCLECGACRIVCDKKSLEWKYPKAGYGVTYKLG